MATQDFQSEYWPNLPADSLSADPIDLTTELDGYVAKSGDTMTGPLVVPDATADGQALAHSQSGAVLNGLTSTGNVTVTGDGVVADRFVDLRDGAGLRVFPTASGYPIETDSPAGEWGAWRIRRAGSTRYFFGMNNGNDEFVIYNNPAVAYTMRADAAGVLYLDTNTSVTVPPVPDGATEAAAQVTAKDSTTGQLQLGGIEIGDTGWRDITSVLTTPTDSTGFEAYLRRSGSSVELRIRFDEASVDTFTSGGVIPSGFQMPVLGDARVGSHNITVAASAARWMTFGGSAQIQYEGLLSSTAPMRFAHTWTTDDAWPASLPGTPV